MGTPVRVPDVEIFFVFFFTQTKVKVSQTQEEPITRRPHPSKGTR